MAWGKAALLCASMGIALAACTEGTKETHILPPDVRLRTGDVVFRQGSGLTSHAVRLADTDGNYSHVGIVADSAGQLLVVHAVPGEGREESNADRVRADKPEAFFSTQRANIGAVARTADSVAAQRAAAAAWQVYKRGTPFDHDYDDTDTLSMYCTELVVHVYKAAGLMLVGSERHEVELPGLKCQCIYPSDVFRSPRLKTIKTF